MQQFKEALSTFHALCLGMILLALCILKFGLIPTYAYYFVWQSTFVFLIIALFLSIYFNKSKLFVLLLFPLFFDLALAFPSTLFTKLSVTAFWHITPLITALGYLLLYALQERGLFSSFGAFRTALGLIVLGIGYLGLKYFSPSMQQALDTPILHASLHGLSKASDFILIISLISLLFIFLISLLFEVQSQKAPFWMLLAQMIPFLFLQESNSFLLFSLVTSLIAISALVHDAYRMAYADTLTGIPSRRALEERFLHLGSHYMIAMADIDFFKKFNDKFGHDIGDDVLKLVAKELSHIKNGGKAYRYGGEEFTILFNGKKKEECIMALEEVRERIFRRGFVIRDKNRPEKVPQEIQKANTVKKERLSISIGLATSSKGKTPNEIIKIADDALYKAKESGRNCLICL
ncbi:GGDEF domain-containing protein [Sulfurospirillum diekertiae]|uniref:diguanylate cyclase n=1 Tax=Sulfurospirillum diekertiae TaxID=1854492 RepID=A0A1Y0HMK8_9BACT|nr:GGDEF domain-containing protein [Sulfurospirillum diekertiae]ARU49359.1 putative diguanylate cyclase YcdT [Sulfurospirillum diekertiae]ASC94168.1 putative diguanylate cyclase YcdT [Sulfurospirillum diekertiae]